ncbi:MAG: hypothetical protein KDC98_17455 [Planctomycetes bacterium]|nr:hypothetical protein [Planctomycetota bacterium]
MRPRNRCLPVLAILAAISPATAQTDWTQLSPATSPSPRTKGQLTYLSGSGTVLMFGGIDNLQTYLDETWTWDGSTWTQENPTNVPTGRIQSRLAYDLVRNVVVMWSGYPGGGSYVQDLWEWTPNGGAPGSSGDWVQVAQSGVWPTQRDHMAMVYDLPRLRTLMFGGWSYFASQTLFNDMWAWDGAVWTQITPANTPPSGRDGHDMVIDEARGQLVLFGGGRAFSAPLGDTWTYDLATDTWTQHTPPNSPPARFNHSLAYDQARQRVVLFGGRTPTQTFNDVWEWDGTDWTQRTPATAPTTRQYGRMAYDQVGERIVMFGGDVNSPFGGGNDETWSYAPLHPASWSEFGSGCRGNNAGASVPHLAGGARPWIGDTADVLLTGLPAPTLAFMLAGFDNTNSPLGPLPLNLAPFGLTLNCALLVDPVAIVALPSASSSATFAIGLPMNASLLGIDIYLQAAATEGAANIVITNAVDGTVGGR